MAKGLPHRLQSIDQFIGKLPELETFLKNYRQFLADFGLYLRAVLDRSSSDPVVRFLQRKEARHSDVDLYHRLLLEFLGDMRLNAVSVQIQTEVREEREKAAAVAREQAAQDALARAERAAAVEEEERREQRLAVLEARTQRIYSLFKTSPRLASVCDLTPRDREGRRGAIGRCRYIEADEHLPLINASGAFVGRVKVIGEELGGEIIVEKLDVPLARGLRVVMFQAPQNEASVGRPIRSPY